MADLPVAVGERSLDRGVGAVLVDELGPVDQGVDHLVRQVIEQARVPRLREDFPGITWSFEGSDAEMRRATASLWGSFGLALAVIYSLLAVAFRGYVQPFIVLVAIPFGIVGAVWAT